MDAIIGASGLVGKHLCSIVSAERFGSANVTEIVGRRFDTIWIAAPSAVKWKANAEPVEDFLNIQTLHSVVQTADARRIVHFSTVDVYAAEQLANGPTELDQAESDCSYGKNRLWLEKNWSADVVQIVRLPGLFGSGLKKNIIFDLINCRNYENISLESAYQWYDLGDMPELIAEINLEKDKIVNVSVEPTLTHGIVQGIFPEVLSRCTGNNGIRYDMRSTSGYRFSKEKVIEQIRRYVESYGSL